jgi:lipoprotein-anchoring transpeptidase ErfK/SrfK
VFPPTLALAAALFATGTAPASAAPATQELALLLAVHTARAAPRRSAAMLQVVQVQRPLTGERTALPVLGRATGPHGSTWLHVLLPGRPNGHTGWIVERATRHAVTSWRIVVHTGTRSITVYDKGRAVRSFRAVVGKPSTPTPGGRFFVEEAVELAPGDVGAPYALALSARSNVLQEFDGGPGQIALHGLSNVGGVLGTAASHGCVRLANDVMHWLVVRIGPGVPVTIRQ